MWLLNQWDTNDFPLLLGEAACICLLTFAQVAQANPTGGSLASGGASISSSGTTTTITQTTQKAIINWHDFSINQNETTQFVQPSSSAVMLNRVTGADPSKIMGNLNANGKIYLINPNGILFGSTAVVNVGGLVASTSAITDSDFLNDKIQHFTQSKGNASIINEGQITIKNAGLAVLVSPTVINSGVIIADLGVVSIASADHFTLDLYGDNLITFDAGNVLNENGFLENTGILQANGGKIYITAQAADKALENIVNMDGYISAQSVSNQKGKIVLQGYDNSTINIAGHVDISGDVAGTLQASANNIHLLNGSSIDASGLYGGGIVNIGGEYQGGGTLAHANNVTMDNNATINADALQTGNGGQVILWADDSTLAHGTITARGGSISGDGGLIETSAHNLVDVGGARISAQAFNGKKGLWLTDPFNDDVSDAEAAAYSSSLDAGTDVAIWATDDITFSNTVTPVSWAVGDGVFSVRSDFDQNGVGTIVLNGGCTVGVNCLVTTTSGTINYYYNPTVFGTPDTFGSVSVAGAGVFNPYMLVNNAAQLQAIGTNATTLSRYYALNKSISSIGAFTSLGGQGSGWDFTGKFTGAVYQNDSNSLTYYTLSGYTITGGGLDQIGLFGSVLAGTVANVRVSSVTVSGHSKVGGIIGDNAGTADQLFMSSGSVSGTSTYVGGLVGFNNGTLSNSAVVSSTITGTGTDTGGIAGYNTLTATIHDVSFSGTLSGGAETGGITGYNDGLIYLTQNLGTVSGTGGSVGALVGNNNAGNLFNSIYALSANPTLSAYGINSGTVGSLVGASNATLSSFALYSSLLFSSSIWELVGPNYASLIWCGSSCRTVNPGYVTVPTGIDTSIITTQIVNAETEYKQEIPVELELIIGLLMTHGSDIMDQLTIPSGLDGAMVGWFLTNSVILETGAVMSGAINTDPVSIMLKVNEVLAEHFICK